MNVDIRVLGRNDAHVPSRVAPDVFDNEFDPNLTAEFLADPRHHIAVALDGDTVVGMASAVDYLHPDKPAELWVNEVGVAPDYQRRGVGRRLMEALIALGHELGCREVWVTTEHDNEPARKLYESVGGQDESCVMYCYKLSDGASGDD